MRPLFARNKYICSVKCFCKWLNGLIGCRATGVQVVWSWMMSWFRSVIRFLRGRHQILLPHIIPGHFEGRRSWLRVPPLNQIVAPWHAEPPLWTLSSPVHSLYQPCTDVWLHQLSWDKPHETFLTFLKCVANQEWPLMCGGFSNWERWEEKRGEVMPYSCIILWRYNIQFCKWSASDLYIFIGL